MRTVYTIRTRYAFPAVVALLIAVLLAVPAESLLASGTLLHRMSPDALGLAVRLVLFVWIFYPAQQLWKRWMSRRPTLIPVRGSRAPNTPEVGRKPELPGA